MAEQSVKKRSGQLIERGRSKFLVRIYLGTDANGKRKYHSKTITGGRKQAEAYLNKILHKKNSGTLADSGKITVAEHMDLWLEKVIKNRVREKTYLDYRDRVRLYVYPEIGSVRLDRLKPEQIQILYNDMIERGLSPRSVRYVHTLLRNSLQQAIKWERIYRNPADLVSDELPKQRREEMKALTPEQAAAFMEATVYSPMKAFFSLLLSSGMRPGEALGLKWADVDFDNKRVTVNRSLTRYRGGGWSLEEPKTARSRRSIPLPPTVIDDLKEHKRGQNEKILAAKEGEYNDQGFVFAAKNGEPLSDRNILMRHFKPLLKATGLPDIRLYDLRHSCATLLLAAGENPKIVSERLGHASITLTLDTYSHVLPDMQQGAADKLEGILFNGGASTRG